MKNLIILVIVSGLIFTGCGKKNNNESTSTKDEKKEETKSETKPGVNQDSINAVKKENDDKEKMVKFALEEDRMINESNGQFAVTAEASSTYAGDGSDSSAGYSPWQATGKPNVENYSDDGRSWTTRDADKGVEWIRLTFAKPVNATEIRIRQNMGPGAIIKIELIDTDNKSHSVWEGIDKTQYEPNRIQWFITKFDKTAYKTKQIKIILATNTVAGWNEIDAVQLMGE